MESPRPVRIGILSPATPNRPHFKSLDAVLPAGVSIAHEGLSLLGESYRDLAGKEQAITKRARELVQKHRVEGLMLTGGFVTLFNAGIEAKVAEATGLPVASAISSAVSALRALQAKTVLLMTPFDRVSNETIKTHVDKLGFTLHFGPSFDNRVPGTSLNLSADELFELVTGWFKERSRPGDLFPGSDHGPFADNPEN